MEVIEILDDATSGLPPHVKGLADDGHDFVHLGRREEALEIAEWLEKQDSPILRGSLTRWRAAITAALGTGAGALIGTFIRATRWERVPPERLRVVPVVAADGRFGLSASVRF